MIRFKRTLIVLIGLLAMADLAGATWLWVLWHDRAGAISTHQVTAPAPADSAARSGPSTDREGNMVTAASAGSWSRAGAASTPPRGADFV